MNLALVGTGQMGQAVAAVAAEGSHEVTARFNSDRPLVETPPTALKAVDGVSTRGRSELKRAVTSWDPSAATAATA